MHRMIIAYSIASRESCSTENHLFYKNGAHAACTHPPNIYYNNLR